MSRTSATTMVMPAPTASFAGSNSERQSVGLPGHCEDCAQLGHVLAHPDLGCGDVGCNRAHGPDDDVSNRSRLFVTGGFTFPVRQALGAEFTIQAGYHGEDARDLIGSCDALIADVTAPFIEVGLHIAHARAVGIPVLLVAVGRVPNGEVLAAGSQLVLLSSAEAASPDAVASSVTTALAFLGVRAAV